MYILYIRRPVEWIQTNEVYVGSSHVVVVAIYLSKLSLVKQLA